MTREWPKSLERYVGPTPNTTTLRPDRWASGQVTAVVTACLFVVIGGVTLSFSVEPRWGGIMLLCVGLVGGFFPIRDRLKWVRVETTDAGFDIISGWWLFTSKREHIDFSNVQTVRMGSDEKSYGTRLPGYKHVVIEPLAIPFVGDPPGIKVAEMFGLPVPVVEALRDELAARAGKPAVPTSP